MVYLIFLIIIRNYSDNVSRNVYIIDLCIRVIEEIIFEQKC